MYEIFHSKAISNKYEIVFFVEKTRRSFKNKGEIIVKYGIIYNSIMLT